MKFAYIFVFIQLVIGLFLSRANEVIDNELIDVPEIDCHADTIEMRFRTKKRFTGKIYVHGHYSNPDCRVDYSQTNANGEPIGGIRLHHGTCDMDRQRLVQPEGMQFSTVLVISFHPLFVTKTDRAFHINCLYRETIKAVTAGLTVSPIMPQEIAYDMPMPECTYTIRKDELDGPILRHARVGEQVVHRWECRSDMYGMLVHSCFVEDGQGEKQLVIDERGCHIDRIALGDPTYVQDLNMAYRESNVFKLPDRVGVRFSCEIKLCVKDGGGCNGITPPNCRDFQKDADETIMETEAWKPSNDDPLNLTSNILTDGHPDLYINSIKKAKRHANVINYIEELKNTSESTIILSNSTSKINHPKTVTTDLISQYFYVLDSINETDDAENLDEKGFVSKNSQTKANRLTSTSSTASICISSTVFAIFSTIIGLTFALSTFLVLHLLFRQMKTKQMSILSERRISPSNFVFK